MVPTEKGGWLLKRTHEHSSHSESPLGTSFTSWIPGSLSPCACNSSAVSILPTVPKAPLHPLHTFLHQKGNRTWAPSAQLPGEGKRRHHIAHAGLAWRSRALEIQGWRPHSPSCWTGPGCLLNTCSWKSGGNCHRMGGSAGRASC